MIKKKIYQDRFTYLLLIKYEKFSSVQYSLSYVVYFQWQNYQRSIERWREKGSSCAFEFFSLTSIHTIVTNVEDFLGLIVYTWIENLEN